jgi:hypothetical protein
MVTVGSAEGAGDTVVACVGRGRLADVDDALVPLASMGCELFTGAADGLQYASSDGLSLLIHFLTGTAGCRLVWRCCIRNL